MAYTPQGPAASDTISWYLDRMGLTDDEMVPPSIADEIVPILRVAREFDGVNPTVAHLSSLEPQPNAVFSLVRRTWSRFHAFDKAHYIDRRSNGRGVRQFKTSLLRRLEREDAATSEEQIKAQPREIKAFYRQYCEKYIQGLQNAEIPNRNHLTKAYQIAAVLFGVLKCVCPKVPNEILKLHELVAENAEMYFKNIVQLDPESSDQALLRHPEVKQPNDLKIPLQVIEDCTQDFNERNFIAKGGYGSVYRGILTWGDHVNQLVAVKRLDVTGFQGSKEFHTEVSMLSQYQHDNIITLIGFCDDNKEMILVYEYASHGSLDKYLRDTAILGGLSWPQLLKICIGIASALDYLHNHVAEKHRIIHRDIKSANILLDDNWNAKLSDFGLSRIGLANQQNTFVITNLAGTHGYCDPQYERTGFLTKESDVYSFGVVLFEVLCGRLACVYDYHDERRFLHHLARTCYKNGQLDKIIDQKIQKDIKPRTLLKFSSIAYQCLQETREERPTIVEVASQLKEAMKTQLEDEILQDGTSSKAGSSK